MYAKVFNLKQQLSPQIYTMDNQDFRDKNEKLELPLEI